MKHSRRLLAVLALAVVPLAACSGVRTDAAVRSQPEAPRTLDPEQIGSTRNARVALANAAAQDVLFLAGAMTEAQLEDLRKTSPNLRILHGLSRERALELAPDAQGVDARFATPEFLQKANKLVWVQAMSAGVDHLVAMPALKERGQVVLTNMRAVHGPAIADHSFAMLLALTRNMNEHAKNQRDGRWSRGDAPGSPSIALAGRTMLVVGIGGIGSEIAQRAHGFGMRVWGTRRSDAPAAPYVERVGKSADLLAMLPEADVVAIALPLTDETRGLFNDAAFAVMKPGCYLINIARGGIVQTDALLKALDSGRLAGACLDVTDPEPLPAGHPLWSRTNVVITPHVAADAELTQERRWTLLRENLRRFAAGEPLLNVVDMTAGY